MPRRCAATHRQRHPWREPDRTTASINDPQFSTKRSQRKEKHDLHNFSTDQLQNSI